MRRQDVIDGIRNGDRCIAEDADDIKREGRSITFTHYADDGSVELVFNASDVIENTIAGGVYTIDPEEAYHE